MALPANHHLLVHPDGSVALSDAARMRSLRPAADVCFASVALVFTTRGIAVVLQMACARLMGVHHCLACSHIGGVRKPAVAEGHF